VALVSWNASLLQQPSSPIIVRVLESDEDSAFNFAQLLVQAVGLSGALVLLALVLGLFLGGAILAVRILRARASGADEPLRDPLSITSPPGLKH
jgi:hypothetical protein